MTPIEDTRIGKWENKLLREFKTAKIAKAPKKNLRRGGADEEGGAAHGSDDEGGGVHLETDNPAQAQELEISEMAVPSDITINPIIARNNPLVKE